MADSIAEQIIDAIVARLQGITVGGGFNTSPSVGRNRPNIDASGGDPLPALVVQEQQESSTPFAASQRMRNQFLLVILCYTRGDLSELIADVKTAVFVANGRNLGGLAHDVRQEGWRRTEDELATDLQTAAVEVTVVYDENYGDPYTLL